MLNERLAQAAGRERVSRAAAEVSSVIIMFSAKSQVSFRWQLRMTDVGLIVLVTALRRRVFSFSVSTYPGSHSTI